MHFSYFLSTTVYTQLLQVMDWVGLASGDVRGLGQLEIGRDMNFC